MYLVCSKSVPVFTCKTQALITCRKCLFRLSHTSYGPRTASSVFQNEVVGLHLNLCHCRMIHSFQKNRHFHTSSSYYKRQTLYQNPLMKLQPYLEIPILPKNNQVFSPSASEMENASELFKSRPRDKHEIKFIKSVVNLENLPEHDLPEVAFLGRSNVGKSSLIRALLCDVPGLEVKVSKRPGHTRALNMFQVGKAFCLVDMPGYGYNMPHHFHQSVEKYLQSRKKLCRSFVLIDSEIGITKTDTIGLKMMEDFRIPYVLVLTKIDKVGHHILLKNVLAAMKVRDESHDLCCFPQPFLASSVTGEGLLLLQSFIAYVTGNLLVEGL
ncbi:GTP-binding protein 8-like [Gigantopelta aegis]|uniref:GTP-binding protein 8-like n=1 Tax=Gigantopelta aegis TaxID=1735272 RepID=UPI001B88C2C8|nr:GTP-binding protein 8-like [Gigantopelta aegis]